MKAVAIYFIFFPQLLFRLLNLSWEMVIKVWSSWMSYRFCRWLVVKYENWLSHFWMTFQNDFGTLFRSFEDHCSRFAVVPISWEYLFSIKIIITFLDLGDNQLKIKFNEERFNGVLGRLSLLLRMLKFHHLKGFKLILVWTCMNKLQC